MSWLGRKYVIQAFYNIIGNACYGRISNEMYERLRQILEKQNGRNYTFEEAKELMMDLLISLNFS
jgi:hypothetical protein